MQLVTSRIWTRVAVFISYDDNHYTTGTFEINYTQLTTKQKYQTSHFDIEISSIPRINVTLTIIKQNHKKKQKQCKTWLIN